MVGLPIALGMLSHLIWGWSADDYILIVWCLCGLYFDWVSGGCSAMKAFPRSA
jgi:hypothetical protein